MNEEKVKKIIQDEAQKAQYSFSKVPFHTHNNLDSPQLISNRYILYRILDPTTTEATGTAVGGDFVMPFNGAITVVGATVDTAGTTGTTQVDINKNGSSILTTKITIDSGETDSRDALVPPAITQANTFSVGDIFTFDVDTVQTTPAMGLTVFMNVTTLL